MINFVIRLVRHNHQTTGEHPSIRHSAAVGVAALRAVSSNGKSSGSDAGLIHRDLYWATVASFPVGVNDKVSRIVDAQAACVGEATRVAYKDAVVRCTTGANGGIATGEIQRITLNFDQRIVTVGAHS